MSTSLHGRLLRNKGAYPHLSTNGHDMAVVHGEGDH
jgi:hypothetical protein